VNQYWKDYAALEVGSWIAPIFQVAANPWIVTGGNKGLQRVDLYPATSAEFAERPACVTVNKPTRFFGDPGSVFDVDQPGETFMVYEPDAFAIRFGYDDQRSEWGDGFDEAWYNQNLPGNL
jgi:hypothetical protein